METIEIKDLVGLRWLSGVSFEQRELVSYGDSKYDASVISFELDGKIYTAIEDYNDGYRSAMESITVEDGFLKERFYAHQVFGVYKSGSTGYNSCDIIQFFDVKTNKVVLEVGTDNADDYYPSFVSYFSPENLYMNQPLP